jgi:putative ABC transport system permease protein
MLRPRGHKVGRDLWLNKSRTLIVVLSIAVGVFAVGTLATSQITLILTSQASFLPAWNAPRLTVRVAMACK